MKEEKLDARDLLDVDRLPMIEAKVAFIAMAASALGMLDSKGLWDGLLPPEPWKAWEGLAWITDEIRNDLHEWLERVK